MNIIFLDIDGVLRTESSDKEWSLKLELPIPEKRYRNFSVKSVSNINFINSLVRCKIVVTSNWKLYYSLAELKQIFRDQGILLEVIDKTGISTSRGEEILEWLLVNDGVENWVVIDDQVKDLSLIDDYRIVKCDHQIGFDDDNLVDKVLDVLI
jgi:hypothetical protein